MGKHRRQHVSLGVTLPCCVLRSLLPGGEGDGVLVQERQVQAAGGGAHLSRGMHKCAQHTLTSSAQVS